MASFAACKLAKFAELPVTMFNLKPMISAKINGRDVQLLADSGAFYSMIRPDHATELGLPFKLAPSPLDLQGFGGAIATRIAIVKEFTLAGTRIPNVEFVVGGAENGQAGAGILGQNVLRIADTEYDLGNGMIRLMRPEDCKHAVLAYWVKDGGSYSEMDIDSSSALEPHTRGAVFLNGHKMRVMFDTGSGTSWISIRSAERAGVPLNLPGVVEEKPLPGFAVSGRKTYIAPFTRFKIGDEEIVNARLRITDFNEAINADMIIGADFFLSHRIYVSTSQHKLYFTYNGGPVFRLPVDGPDVVAADAVPGAGSPSAAPPEEALSAAEFARRGSARMARRDYSGALADFNRACEQEPNNLEFLNQRGFVYWRSNRPELAIADFDRVLQLAPGNLTALVSRAILRVDRKDVAGASADLDAADRVAAKEAEERLALALNYQTLESFDRAVAQYDLWIKAHPADMRMPRALGYRCLAKAWLGENLPKALSDCDAALRMAGKDDLTRAGVLDGRGLIYLRSGDFGKAIKDYDAAIELRPTEADSLYGRGIAKIRNKDSSGGNLDIAAAIKLKPSTADDFTARGIVP